MKNPGDPRRSGTLLQRLLGFSGPDSPQDAPSNEVYAAFRRSVIKDLTIWFGETAFACLPIMTYFWVINYSNREAVEAICHPGLTQCVQKSIFPFSEFDIISVVLSGLGILSLLELDRQPIGDSRSGSVPYMAGLMQLAFLIFATILYTVQVLDAGRGGLLTTLAVFTLCLVLSFYLTFARAWRDALTPGFGAGRIAYS